MPNLDTAQRQPENVILRLQRRIDTLEAEKVRFQKEITDLKAEIAEYERQLRSVGGAADEDMVLQLVNFARMTPKELKMLSLLASRREGMTKNGLMTGLYAHGYSDKEVPEVKIVDVFICKLRRKLKEHTKLPDHTIETVWGKGYRIAADQFEAVRDLLHYPS
jgi:DNA-binding response OmpR family regulator